MSTKVTAEVLVELINKTELARTEPEVQVKIQQLEVQVKIQQFKEFKVLLIAIHC